MSMIPKQSRIFVDVLVPQWRYKAYLMRKDTKIPMCLAWEQEMPSLLIPSASHEKKEFLQSGVRGSSAPVEGIFLREFLNNLSVYLSQ